MAKRKRAKRKNPTKKRAHAKRTHKRAKAANPPARRRRARHANPKRSHARRTRRASRPNPRRHSKRTHRRNPRAVAANPRRRSSKRRHRRNPAIPVWAMAGLGAALGLLTYGIANDGSFAITQRTDPTLATLQRNRYIVSGVLTVAGLALAALASPILGCGVAAGGLASLAGTQLSLAMGKVLDKKNADGSLQTAQPAAPAIKGLGAVYDGQQQQFGALFTQGQQQFGALYDGGGQLFGNVYDNAGDGFAG